jgi:hypothetical protein
VASQEGLISMKFQTTPDENPGPTDGNDAVTNTREASLPSDDERAKTSKTQ